MKYLLFIYLFPFVTSAYINEFLSIFSVPTPQTKGQLWPYPEFLDVNSTIIHVDPNDIRLKANLDCTIIQKAYERFLNKLPPLPPQTMTDNKFIINLNLYSACEDVPNDLMKEQYEMKVHGKGVDIKVHSVWGAVRAFTSLAQLVYKVIETDESNNSKLGLLINESYILDQPRFPYRGLLIDSSRHFLNTSTILLNLDAMEQNKLNVLHWHVVDDQSFPFYSITFPDLSLKGAYKDSYVYKPRDVKAILKYAHERGIRVMMEFDTPGHTLSWGKAFPELLTTCYEKKYLTQPPSSSMRPTPRPRPRLPSFNPSYPNEDGQTPPATSILTNAAPYSFSERNNLIIGENLVPDSLNRQLEIPKIERIPGSRLSLNFPLYYYHRRRLSPDPTRPLDRKLLLTEGAMGGGMASKYVDEIWPSKETLELIKKLQSHLSRQDFLATSSDGLVKDIPPTTETAITPSINIKTPPVSYELIEEKGIKGPLDPTQNQTYQFLDEFFTEIFDRFPETYVHIGGDEVLFSCWQSNPEITKFMEDLQLNKSNYASLENYFLSRLLQTLAARDQSRKFVVWQEIFDNGVEINKDNTIIEIWKGPLWTNYLRKVLKSKTYAILSSPWYLNYIKYGRDWMNYYLVDPFDMENITEEDKTYLLGGEICMWGEYIDDSNLLSTLWPRASAVAERLWSPSWINNSTEAAPRLMEHTCRMKRWGIQAAPSLGPGYCE